MSVILRPGVQRPPAGLIARFGTPIQRVASVWLAIGRKYPVEITSWYRPQAINASAGGKTYSQHLVGAAMDGVVKGYTRAQILPLVQKVARHYGVTAPSAASETSGNSVHVQGLPVGYVQTLVQREPGLIASAEAFIGPPRRIV